MIAPYQGNYPVAQDNPLALLAPLAVASPITLVALAIFRDFYNSTISQNAKPFIKKDDFDPIFLNQDNFDPIIDAKPFINQDDFDFIN